MNDDRIDFSALDPLSNPERLERAVQAVLDGGSVPRSSRPFERAVVAHGRNAFLAACAAAAASWLLVATATPESARTLGRRQDPLATLDRWAQAGENPGSIDVLRLLEDPADAE